MENNKFEKSIIPIEIDLGFIRVPNKYKKLFPKINSKVKIYLAGKKVSLLSYNAKEQRITGLVKFFRSQRINPKDILKFQKVGKKTFNVSIKKVKSEKVILTQEAAEEMIDVGKLSPVVKGNIVEERIAHLIFLYGQGELNIYKPIADIEGIDLIVVKRGIYQPLYIQVKSKFKLRNNNFQIGVKSRALRVHHSSFIVGAYFNPQKMDIDDYIILAPSKDFVKKANVINKGTKKELLVLCTRLNPNTNNRFSKFIIRKDDLVAKIFEKFNKIKSRKINKK